MGTARVEIVRLGDRYDQFPGVIKEIFQTAKETTSTTATVAGSRIQVATTPAYTKLHARIVHDEACWVAVGADPTAADAPALGYQTAPNVPLIIPVAPGDKLSFKELA
jgi:hypothetical protein